MTRIQQGGDYLNLGSAVQKGELGGFIVPAKRVPQ